MDENTSHSNELGGDNTNDTVGHILVLDNPPSPADSNASTESLPTLESVEVGAAVEDPLGLPNTCKGAILCYPNTEFSRVISTSSSDVGNMIENAASPAHSSDSTNELPPLESKVVGGAVGHDTKFRYSLYDILTDSDLDEVQTEKKVILNSLMLLGLLYRIWIVQVLNIGYLDIALKK